MGFGDLLVALIYPYMLYLYCEILTVSYMLVRHKRSITVTKLFLKLKYIFMCLWLLSQSLHFIDTASNVVI